MLYVIALFVPPLAVLCCGKLLSTIISFVLWIIGLAAACTIIGIPFYFIPVIHAWAVIGSCNADRRTARIVDAIERSKA